jgi:hypothetical protein
MALFGLFGKKSEDSQLRKLAERATKKHAQAVDRWEAIQTLARMGTSEAVEALLPRFAFYVDPTITDQEEKDVAFDGIVAAGESALEPVLSFLRKADSISWPIKMLDKLVSSETVVEKLVELLASMDVEYERDPQRKIQVLATLEERSDPRIAPAVARFLQDANETVRFNTVGALLAQDDCERQRDELIACYLADESVRIRNRILDGFIAREWTAGDRADEIKAKMPASYTLDTAGRPRRS